MFRFKNKMRNQDLAKLWGSMSVLGFPSKEYTNHEKTFRMFTDGKIYSYRLLIGEVKDNKLIVYNCTAKGGQFYSKTTSRHVSLILPFADKVISYNEK